MDEERTKNDHEIVHRNVTEAFFFFLFILLPSLVFSMPSPTYFSLLCATHPFPNLLIIFFPGYVANGIVIPLLFFFGGGLEYTM